MRKTGALIASQLLVCALMSGAGEPGAGEAPVFSAAERSIIATLAPPALPPPPPDRTNRFAGNPLAAELGKKLFFDARFSGPLLEGDNDGGPATLGKKGQTGRVACAGCHIPAAGFQDNRTLGYSISLAAGWGRRHAPSLYDVGQQKLLMWDGRRDTFHSQIFEALESPVGFAFAGNLPPDARHVSKVLNDSKCLVRLYELDPRS